VTDGRLAKLVRQSQDYQTIKWIYPENILIKTKANLNGVPDGKIY
jgi:hypothetical protein